MLVIVRYTAESLAAVNEKRAADRAVTDHGDLTVKLTADTLRLQMNHVCTKPVTVCQELFEKTQIKKGVTTKQKSSNNFEC